MMDLSFLNFNQDVQNYLKVIEERLLLFPNPHLIPDWSDEYQTYLNIISEDPPLLRALWDAFNMEQLLPVSSLTDCDNYDHLKEIGEVEQMAAIYSG